MDFNILLHKELYNKKSKEQLREKLALEDFNRITCSFYKYVSLDNLEELRDQLYTAWNSLDVLGRIYLSNEEVPPPIMKLLIFMSIFLVAGFFLLGVQNIWAHFIMIISFSVTIQLVISLLIDLNNPFSGIWNINNKSYVVLAQKIYSKMEETQTH